MPKKNNAGCGGGANCCCGPVTERVDEFTSWWSCFQGFPNGYSVLSGAGQSVQYNYNMSVPGAGWNVSGGQLIYSPQENNDGVQDILCIDAVRMPYPFSMEFILEVAELNNVGGDQAYLSMQMVESGDGTSPTTGKLQAALSGAGPVSASAQAQMGSNTRGSSHQNLMTSLPCEIWYKIKCDTDGITHYLWYNGVAPDPIFGGQFGIKTTATPSTIAGTRLRYWSLHVRNASGYPRTNWAKFNRMEVRQWDHTQITMPDPDNP